ncbi:hypothetical protein [Geobacter sp. OR-1]|uniref:hypothetical protein n=1 Tax=Geobacter sp. OR-1 TaxID=1266765 RepID=UPI00136488A8|nr:hypothetical protein [Geobacter sp. OR-1]
MIMLTPGLSLAAGLNAEMTKYLQGLELQAKKQEAGFKGFDAEKGRKLFLIPVPMTRPEQYPVPPVIPRT